MTPQRTHSFLRPAIAAPGPQAISIEHKLETTAVVAAALQLCLVSPLARLLLVRSRLTQPPGVEVGASHSLHVPYGLLRLELRIGNPDPAPRPINDT